MGSRDAPPALPDRLRHLCFHAPPLLFLVIAATAFLWPWIKPWQLATRLQTIDSGIVVWVLAWGHHALDTPGARFFDANIFWPMENSLATTVHLRLLSLITYPLHRAGAGPVLVFNLLFTASVAANALAAYALAWTWCRRRGAAVLAAMMFAFSPVMQHHLNGQLHILAAWWIPLAILATERFLRKPSWRWGGAYYLIVQGACLQDWYMAVLVTSCVTVTCLVHAVRWAWRREWTKSWRVAMLAVVGAACAGVSLPLAAPYLEIERGKPAASWSDIRATSGKIYAYGIPTSGGGPVTVTGLLAGKAAPVTQRIVYPQHPGYVPGLLFGGLVLGGGVLLWKRRRGRAPGPVARRFEPVDGVLLAVALALAAVSFTFSLGPFMYLRGNAVYLPYAALLAALPELSFFRAPFRYNTITALAVGLALGLVLAAVRDGGLRRRLSTGLVLVLIVEFYPVRVVTHHFDFDWRGAQDFGGSAFGAVGRGEPVLEVPALGSMPMLWSMAHFRPLLNGTSAYDPAGRFRDLGYLDRELPSRRGVTLLREMGASHVILHDPAARDAFLARGHFILVSEYGPHSVLRVRDDFDPVTFRAPRPVDRVAWPMGDGAGAGFYPNGHLRLDIRDDGPGVLFKVTGPDPFLTLPLARSIDGVDYPAMELEIAVTGAGTDRVGAVLYWATAEDPHLDEVKAHSFLLPADGEVHRARVELARDSFAWRASQRITALRLDPTTAFPGNVRVAGVSLAPDHRGGVAGPGTVTTPEP